MAALQHFGAAAPGDQSRPAESGEAPALAGAKGFGSQAQEVSLDCSAKLTATEAAVSSLRVAVKRVIVFAGCWGFPATAHWLLDRLGLKHD